MWAREFGLVLACGGGGGLVAVDVDEDVVDEVVVVDVVDVVDVDVEEDRMTMRYD